MQGQKCTLTCQHQLIDSSDKTKLMCLFIFIVDVEGALHRNRIMSSHAKFFFVEALLKIETLLENFYISCKVDAHKKNHIVVTHG
jgi:hypothetical protein